MWAHRKQKNVNRMLWQNGAKRRGEKMKCSCPSKHHNRFYFYCLSRASVCVRDCVHDKGRLTCGQSIDFFICARERPLTKFYSGRSEFIRCKPINIPNSERIFAHFCSAIECSHARHRIWYTYICCTCVNIENQIKIKIPSKGVNMRQQKQHHQRYRYRYDRKKNRKFYMVDACSVSLPFLLFYNTLSAVCVCVCVNLCVIYDYSELWIFWIWWAITHVLCEKRAREDGVVRPLYFGFVCSKTLNIDWNKQPKKSIVHTKFIL